MVANLHVISVSLLAHIVLMCACLEAWAQVVDCPVNNAEGPFACDEEGNVVCANGNLSPESNCTQCLEEGRDPGNNCAGEAGECEAVEYGVVPVI